MKRYLSPALAALCTASIALVGCDSDGGAGNTTPAADTTTGADADATVGGDADAAAETDTPGAGTDATTTDTTPDTAPVPCGGPCASDETCNPTTDKCEKKAAPCDGACTATQFCDLLTNKCVDQKCTLPTTFGPNLQKISKLEVPKPDGGCDLDDDGKPNNVLGKVVDLYKDLNKTLAKNVADGTIAIIFEPTEYKTDGSEFDFDLLIGDLDASNADCDATTASCKYTVSKLSYDLASQVEGTCPALVTFNKSVIKDLKLTSGGKDQKFALTIPVVGIALKLTISQASIAGTVSSDKEWIDTKSGKVCGVIAKEDLDAAIDAVPEELLAQIGDKATVKSLVAGILKPDIDTDEDGAKDAISVALDFESVKAEITGITPDKK